MRRREFVIAGGSTLTILAMIGHAAPRKRSAAVVIGVDKPDGLPHLSGAASGAKEVAAWLKGEGFEVTVLTDETTAVHADSVAAEVDNFVKAGVYDQFVLYFAGHGFQQNYDEVWILSGAPHNAADAIGLNGSNCLALTSGIPNVIIISDCCRSIPTSFALNFVQGRPAFPATSPTPGKSVKVDRFCATGIGAAAYEVTVDQSVSEYKGIFTSALLSAFQSPDDSYVTQVDGQSVITDTNLAMYLDAEVPRRAQAAHIARGQFPQNTVGPDPKNYLGKVQGPVRHATSPPPPPATVGTLASVAIGGTGGHLGGPIPLSPQLQSLSDTIGFESSKQQILVAARGIAETDIQSGFIVFGKAVASVATLGPVSADVVNATGRSAVAVHHGSERTTTLGLRFEDGSGCVLPALKDFIAAITVDEQGIANVSYTPVFMRQSSEQLEKYRAAVATAAKYGAFRIQDPRVAASFASNVRLGKMYDCTLGIYAAYAYADAGMREGVRSVLNALRSEYGTTFFDVALLSGDLREVADKDIWNGTLVACCPALAQGWSLLEAKGVQLPEALRDLGHYTKRSLWTTFNPAGMARVERYLSTLAAKSN